MHLVVVRGGAWWCMVVRERSAIRRAAHRQTSAEDNVAASAGLRLGERTRRHYLRPRMALCITA
jgi:hypothetical protein